MRKLIKHPNNRILGKTIRFIRKDKKISGNLIAKHLDITHQQLMKYETGKNRIPAIMLWKIAEFSSVDIKIFFKDLVGF